MAKKAPRRTDAKPSDETPLLTEAVERLRAVSDRIERDDQSIAAAITSIHELLAVIETNPPDDIFCGLAAVRLHQMREAFKAFFGQPPVEFFRHPETDQWCLWLRYPEGEPRQLNLFYRDAPELPESWTDYAQSGIRETYPRIVGCLRQWILEWDSYVDKRLANPEPRAVDTKAIVTIDPPQITLVDGTAFAITQDQATYLSELVASGDWMSDPEFRKKDLATRRNARPDRWRKNLPAEVLCQIETTDRGSRWIKTAAVPVVE